ncbi:MAG: serine hydrolase [Nitrospirae bacterium]|nr:serine hydrolase [Candidatus Troglogloeales bacterium]
MGGDKWVRPLLVCDINPLSESQNLQSLKDRVDEEIRQGVQRNIIKTASVYFRNLTTSEQFSVRGDEKFFPSSLRKVPLLISVLKMAESAPDILNKVKVNLTGEDQNDQQEIKPKEFAEVGKTYLVEDLLEKMIRYSDNNATAALSSVSGVDTIRGVFENLYVPFIGSPPVGMKSEEEIEGLTAYQFSFFLRVLYNATYLGNEFSARALRLMSQVDFKEGLRAGLPDYIPVAHKFGLMTVKLSDGPIVSRQLHDCGIVYHPKRPYILCIMTKSAAPISNMEQFIGRLSAIVYTGVEKLVDKT